MFINIFADIFKLDERIREYIIRLQLLHTLTQQLILNPIDYFAVQDLIKSILIVAHPAIAFDHSFVIYLFL
jgi:hypothetical protein